MRILFLRFLRRFSTRFIRFIRFLRFLRFLRVFSVTSLFGETNRNFPLQIRHAVVMVTDSINGVEVILGWKLQTLLDQHRTKSLLTLVNLFPTKTMVSICITLSKGQLLYHDNFLLSYLTKDQVRGHQCKSCCNFDHVSRSDPLPELADTWTY